MDEEKLWNATECAEYLGVHPQTVYRNQNIPRHRIGELVRFVPAEIRAWVSMNAERKRPPKKTARLYDVSAK